MRPRHPVPADTMADQAAAADPINSAWVAANAGSGKTHVLSRRVMRLLLGGADPSRILCLTYTKAAAANMSNRVFEALARWTVLDDTALAAELSGLEGRAPKGDQIREARRLFARALETPGGLKIQTIHAFCEAVLHQFPLEANIAGHFELLDAIAEQSLVAEARREMLTGIHAGDSALAAAFAEVLSRGGEYGLDVLLSEIVGKRDQIRAFLKEIGGAAELAVLDAEFGFPAGADAALIARPAIPAPGFSSVEIDALEEATRAVGCSQATGLFLAGMRRAEAQADAALRLRLLGEAFLKQDGEPYNPTWLFGKPLRLAIPDLAERYVEAARIVSETIDRLRLFEMVAATKAALTLADDLVTRYERLKTARGFLDFNDLISRTVGLLSRTDASAWIRYRLDAGIDHILIDEAQDTSPGQWEVIRALASEFFAGKGSREEVSRTVFAVGDEKQSIYSFQGAEPHAFAETRFEFAQRIEAVGQRFRPVRLWRSFRSVGDVLSAVDLVFADPQARRGLTRDQEAITHEPIRRGAAGYVELWPSLGRKKADEPDDWAQPIDHVTVPAVILAERIAATIRRWIDNSDVLEETGRRITAGDILVLVRKRDRFVHALSRALKNLKDSRIAVAGADRLDLAGHIAVQDLIAIGRFALQTDDDLSLAALLKSPLFGLDEEALFRLSWNRPPGMSLWQRLREAADIDPDLRPIESQLAAWRAQADLVPVFEFYAGVLGRDGGRRKFLQRLGHEAGEILDEFLSFCLAEERTGLPGLEAFLATLGEASPEIKREMDQGRDEVRIMTVHASKGLEAPVVFLVDDGAAPFSASHLPRLAPFMPRAGLWSGKGWLWRASADIANSASRPVEAEIRAKAEEEYRRLLYVGMTRAEDRLIVCGYHGLTAKRHDAWHAMVERALSASPDTRSLPHPAAPEETVLRFRTSPSAVAAAHADGAAEPAATVVMPSWVDLAPPPADILPRPLSPSGVAVLVGEERVTAPSAHSPVLDPHREPAFAIRRGIVVHRLLQMLPDLVPELREPAARRYLERAAGDWTADEHERTWRAVERVLSDDGFAPVFAPGSRAEVAVAGIRRIGGRDRAVSARIDRVAIGPDRILIVDYKTGRPPERPADVASSYLVQMALYRDLVAPLYPGCRIEAALLFTETPMLVALSDQALDESLAHAGIA